MLRKLKLTLFVVGFIVSCKQPSAVLPVTEEELGRASATSANLIPVGRLTAETLRCPALDHSGATISRVEFDNVWVWFRYWPVPYDGRAVVWFYPFGRHTTPRFDIDLGQVEVGAELTGEYGPFHVPGITEPTTLPFNIDFELYGLDGEILIQCDRGPAGQSVVVTPRPPDPPAAEAAPTPPPPTTTTAPPQEPDPCAPMAPLKAVVSGSWRSVPVGTTRYQAQVTTAAEFAPGPAFIGELQVFWVNGSSTFIKARLPLNFACHAVPRTEVLTWQSEVVPGSHPHVNCTVRYYGRLFEGSGKLVAAQELRRDGACP